MADGDAFKPGDVDLRRLAAVDAVAGGLDFAARATCRNAVAAAVTNWALSFA